MQTPLSLRFPIFIFQAMLLLFLSLPLPGQVQDNSMTETRPRSILVYSDLYKTDFQHPWRKLQAGLEVGYHLNDKMILTGGLEFWNAQPSPLISIGNRFHPYGPAFIRYRALLGVTADVALGLGYSQAISSHWQLQAASDYYLNDREIGFRLGLGYLWRDKRQN